MLNSLTTDQRNRRMAGPQGTTKISRRSLFACLFAAPVVAAQGITDAYIADQAVIARTMAASSVTYANAALADNAVIEPNGYGHALRFTRQALINDDLGGLISREEWARRHAIDIDEIDRSIREEQRQMLRLGLSGWSAHA